MKIKKIRDAFAGWDINAFITNKLENIRYLTGFTGSSAGLAITGEQAIFFADPRYTDQASRETTGVEIRECKNFFDEVTVFLKDSGNDEIGFESAHISYADYGKIRKNPGRRRLIGTSQIVEDCRIIKEPQEIQKIQTAVDISGKAFREVRGYIRPGVTEWDISAELEYRMRKGGAEAIAFHFIVASGKRGGLPHGIASKKRLESGDLVTIDFGARHRGYFSDCTRTVCVGEWDERKREVYTTVSAAQKKGIKAVREGVTAGEVDRAARGFIQAAGYGERFGHGTGHGVGLEIHEAPRIAKGQETVLKAGMVITIEPGIYIPDWGGVRIEDMVLVEKEGCTVLTASIPGQDL